jgi:hypothetical protein
MEGPEEGCQAWRERPCVHIERGRELSSPTGVQSGRRQAEGGEEGMGESTRSCLLWGDENLGWL